MELWYSENHTENVKFSIKVNRQLYSGQSEYQRIDVFESPEFGRFLTLDGLMMLTERDEFIYHEMLVHVPMAVHPAPQRVLVVGAGDGGIARELAKYPAPLQVDLVEIDRQVVEVCRQFLPGTACGFNNPGLTVHYQDGLRFIRACENLYDIIIVDSTDPFGPGEGLFTKEFYGSCYKALKEDGIMVNQHESPFYSGDALAMQRAHARIVKSFPISRVYQAHIPTYPSGHWLFGFAAKRCHPVKDLKASRWKSLGLETRYYNTNLHRGAFCLPTYVEKVLKECENDE
ncbi:MAG: polyamine aminopropyltransferase [Oscillospiraceae bacterium]